jgi:hypothetical protein
MASLDLALVSCSDSLGGDHTNPNLDLPTALTAISANKWFAPPQRRERHFATMRTSEEEELRSREDREPCYDNPRGCSPLARPEHENEPSEKIESGKEARPRLHSHRCVLIRLTLKLSCKRSTQYASHHSACLSAL